MKKSLKGLDDVQDRKKPSADDTAEGNDSDSYSSTINSNRKRHINQEKMNIKDARTRVFATVIYPESAPDDWEEKLVQAHVSALVSPLHDKDINPDGSQKKAHYHVMVMYENKKNFNTQVKPLFDSIGGVGREEVQSARGYARYLCHMDNPEKYQYDKEEVKCFGGADYTAVVHIATDDSQMLKEIFAYITANHIYSVKQLLDLCAVNNDEWFRLITTNKGYIVKEYIKSYMWELETGYTYAVEDDNKDENENMIEVEERKD